MIEGMLNPEADLEAILLYDWLTALREEYERTGKITLPRFKRIELP